MCLSRDRPESDAADRLDTGPGALHSGSRRLFLALWLFVCPLNTSCRGASKQLGIAFRNQSVQSNFTSAFISGLWSVPPTDPSSR